MSIMDRFRKRNEKFARDFDKGDKTLPPAQRLVVLTCMDARLHPETFLGLDIGDAHVIRNAGGRASDDALRSLIISRRLLGTEEYARHRQGRLQHGLLPFSDVEESVRDDVRRIRDDPFIPEGVEVSGWVYDVKNGKVREVVPPGR
jgi:carbonic anhydrase